MARPGDIPTIHSGAPPERKFSSGPPDDARARGSFPTLDIASALAAPEIVIPKPAANPFAPLGAAALGVTSEHEGRYVAADEGELGRGGIGRVFVAMDRHLDRSVAIKELLLDPGDDENRPGTVATLARFLREARITGKLDHPNIVPVYELGRRADGALYYTMRVVRGRTLSQALDEARSLPARLKLLDHFIGLCQAIAYAHSRGVIHRDIKPDNVMIGEFGETVVLDWGMAKAQASDAPDSDARAAPQFDRLAQSLDLTVDGSLCGTPTHMSPEQARGATHEVDERSDVWALGVVLYTILSGRAPFEGKTLLELIQHIREAKCPRLGSLDEGIPAELAAIAERALKASPSERYPNAQELLRDVEAYRSGSQVHAYRYSSLDLLKRFVSRHRTAAVASGVGLGVALVLAVASYVRLAAARDRAQEAEQRATKNELEARSSERRAKQSLSEVLVEKALQASNEGDRASAELLAAEALALVERADARGVVIAAESSFRPEPTFVLSAASGCTRVALNLPRNALACARNQEITLYSLADGRAESPIALAGTTSALAFSADGSRLAVTSAEGKLSVVSLDDPGRATVFERRLSPLSSVALSSDGGYAACGGPRGGVAVWNLASDRAGAAHSPREWRLPTRQGVSALAFAPDGGSLAVGGELGATVLWDFERGKTHELVGHTGTVRAFAFTQTGHYLATGAADRTIRFWDTREHAQVSASITHSSAVTSLAWSSEGRLLAFGSKDKTLNLLDPKAPERRAQVRFHDDALDALALSPESGQLVSLSRDLGAVRWSLASSKTPSTLVERGNVLAFAFVPGKNELVSAGLGAEGLGVFDLESGVSQTRLPAAIDRIRALAVSSDGSRLAFAGSDAGVMLWDLPARIPLRVFDVHDEVRAVAFSSDDRLLGFAGLDRTLHVVDARTFAKVADFDAGAALQALTFSRKSGLFLSGDRDGMLTGWDVAGKRRALHLKAHDDWLLAVAVSPDGERLATAGADRHVKVWDAASGKLVFDLAGHEGKVLCVAFSTDGRFIASGSEDKSVRVWALAGGQELARITGHGGAVRAVHFAAGRPLLGSASDDGTIRLWKLDSLTASASALRASVATRYRLELAGTRVVRAQ